jgi:hypothetical protein
MMPRRPSKGLIQALALFFLQASLSTRILFIKSVCDGSWWHGDRCAADVPDLLPDNAWHCPIKKSNGQSPSCHVRARSSADLRAVTILHVNASVRVV